MDLSVRSVERTWVSIPFREVPARNMARELPHWTLFEICEVTLECGVRGFGETMCYYTWGTVSDEAVARTTGRNAAELMWDDSLGAGLQMALFDAVGRATGVPCHRLLGRQHRDRAALSWWDIDMPAEDWIFECALAREKGYTSFKSKARPWFDLYDQCERLEESIPGWFDLDLDFNCMLCDTAHAVRILGELEKHPNIAIWESPIPHEDLEGYRHLRSTCRIPIAVHYDSHRAPAAMHQGVCDGFVLAGGASTIMQGGHAIGEADKVCWLQMVGTGITATFALHLAAVLPAARWPAVNCHQLFTRQLLTAPIEVTGGSADIPNAPGLGVELDRDVVEQFRVEPQVKPYPTPGLLLAIRWASGGTSYYSHTMQFWQDFTAGRLPLFERGVSLESIPDDGSPEWTELQQRAQGGGIHT